MPPFHVLAPRLLHTSNIIFKNVAPFCFLAPLLRNPGDGPASSANNIFALLKILKVSDLYQLNLENLCISRFF